MSSVALFSFLSPCFWCPISWERCFVVKEERVWCLWESEDAISFLLQQQTRKEKVLDKKKCESREQNAYKVNSLKMFSRYTTNDKEKEKMPSVVIVSLFFAELPRFQQKKRYGRREVEDGSHLKSCSNNNHLPFSFNVGSLLCFTLDWKRKAAKSKILSSILFSFLSIILVTFHLLFLLHCMWSQYTVCPTNEWLSESGGQRRSRVWVQSIR